MNGPSAARTRARLASSRKRLIEVGPGIAVSSSALFICIAVALSLQGWRALSATQHRLEDTGTDLSGQVFYLVLAGMAGIGSGVLLRRRTPPIPGPERRGSFLGVTAAAMLVLPALSNSASVGWYYLGDLWPALRGPAGGSPAPDLTAGYVGMSVINATSAAFVEEVCALAVPIWLVYTAAGARHLRPAVRRRMLWVVGTMLVAIRVAYHLYQGPSAFAHLPWAVGTVVLYLWTGRLAPIIITHFTTDIAIDLSAALPPMSLWQWFLAGNAIPFLIGAALLISIAAMRRQQSAHRSGGHTEYPSASQPQ